MKKYTYIAGSLGLALIALVALRSFNTAPVAVTNISIFADYVDKSIYGTAILEEALKTIDAQCDHIFMNKSLWTECTQDILKPEFMAQCDMYDTGIGLLYLKQKSITENIGINAHQFSLIKDPFNPKEIDKVQDGIWPQQFDSLFDIRVWNNYHSNPQSKILVYMNGHGTYRTDPLKEIEMGCGMRTTNFAILLKFFNDQLNIHMLGVQSCFWTTERIYELMQQNGYDTLNFTILTPLSIEKGLWLDTINNYLHKKDTVSCFFDCCVSFTQCFNNEVTDEIKDLVYNTDTLKLRENKEQRATVMAAGTDQVVTV